MKTSVRQKLLLVSLLVLLGNGILGYAVYQNNQKLFDSEQWVQHTEQVIYQSGKIQSISKDLETAAGGFVITNDSSFLQQLYTAKKTIFVYIGQLRRLTLDNPAQQRRIDSLSFYVYNRLDFSNKMVELRRKQGLASALAYASAQQGKHFTDRIRQITGLIEQQESILLKQRKQTNMRSVVVFKLLSRVVFISMVVFTIVLLIVTSKYLTQSKENAKRAAELTIANDELLFQNQEKEKRTAELILANEERAKIVSDMIRRNTELEQFAYIISHNLRAPVANIIGASDALSDTEFSYEDKQILTRGINVSVMQLDNVVKDLNHILEIKGEINDTKEIVHFSTLVDNIKASIQNLIDKYNIEIDYDFSEIGEFLTLRAFLYSIFYNLISNSIKYRQQGVRCIIEIRSRLVKNKLELIFRDNGMGIDVKKNGNDVFGLYKRFHTNIEGKGMGLFMVKTQVETLGGKISLQSMENAGAEFKIEFEI